MNRVEKIKRQLSLPSQAEKAWSSLTSKERKVFINLAGLQTFEPILVKSGFDRFSNNHKNKLTKAITIASNIAAKFSAHISPEQFKNKQLKAA